MKPALAVVCALSACFSACCPEARSVRGSVPIKSACTASSRAPASFGLDVRAGRRHSDARTISVTNFGDAARSVRVSEVSRLEGPCSGEWARSTALAFLDAATGQAPEAVTLRKGDHLEITIGPQQSATTWECAKLGLALWMSVDDARVCADAGAWISAEDD